MKTKLHFFILLFCATAATRAQTNLIVEGFENVPALTNGSTTILEENFDDLPTALTNGWVTSNNSLPIGPAQWFQGDPAVMPSQSGAANSCVQANSSSVSGNNTISNWLFSPLRLLKNGDIIKFWTRKALAFDGTDYPDRLEVRLSAAGAGSFGPNSATSVGDYTILLLEINPNLEVGGYPLDYVQYTATVSGLSAPTSCRVALRYFVTNGGTGPNSYQIAIDTFSIKRNGLSTWTIQNNSTPIGATTWQQSDGVIIEAQTGTPADCVTLDFNSVLANNTISNWLIAPTISLQNGDLIKFWTKALFNTGDRLIVRLSPMGLASIIPNSVMSFGSFTQILTIINPLQTATDYPTTWTEYALTVSGIPTPTACRVAFNYNVTNGGPSGPNGNTIGIDTFSIVRPALANETFDLASKISLSPNPVNDAFQLNLNDDVDASNLKVEIYDLNGRIIKLFEKANNYSIADLEAGVYMVKVADGNFAETKRIIKN